MELYIQLATSLEYFDILNKWWLLWQWKKDREIANFIMQNYPWELAETISPQYEVNFVAIREIKKRLWNEIFNKISWIYYWSDNCEYLTPTKAEIEEAINKFKEFNKNFPPHKIRSFTLVTSYVWDKMLSRLEEWLKYLNDLNIKNNIEIVVNDLWVLNLLNTKYKKIKIIFGRVIHKILKTPLIDTYWYEAHPAWNLIKNKSEEEKLRLRADIVKWQIKFYNSSEVGLDIYRKFLWNHSISRITLDYMESRKELYKNVIKQWKDQVWIDLHYPWALIFTGRLCDTSAIEKPLRGMYTIDDICPRTCNRYDIHYKIKTVWYNMIQRWNAWYRSELNLEFLDDTFIKNKNSRFVFSPFISV